MASPVDYNPKRVFGMEWDVDHVEFNGKTKRRIRAKGYSANRVTIIGDSIIQMLSNLLYTSIQSFPGAYARDIVDMCQSGIYVIEGFDLVLVSAGTNDQSKSSILEVLVSFRRIVHHVRQQNPRCLIAICGLLPRPVDSKDESKTKKLDELNTALQADCILINVYYIHTDRAIKGQPTAKVYRDDGIHLTFKGVGYLKSYLEGIIGSILGTPPQ
jgi:hypothetical protein